MRRIGSRTRHSATGISSTAWISVRAANAATIATTTATPRRRGVTSSSHRRVHIISVCRLAVLPSTSRAASGARTVKAATTAAWTGRRIWRAHSHTTAVQTPATRQLPAVMATAMDSTGRAAASPAMSRGITCR
ncbi:hypothetical protein CQ044_13375 [Microbacterium sp. MYb64]|nr:hypothetical protein CQ044_13375 [Microbacterium sp. MYb64]